jgi:hypothetical protein
MEKWLNVLFAVFAVGWLLALIVSIGWNLVHAPTPGSVP